MMQRLRNKEQRQSVSLVNPTLDVTSSPGKPIYKHDLNVARLNEKQRQRFQVEWHLDKESFAGV